MGYVKIFIIPEGCSFLDQDRNVDTFLTSRIYKVFECMNLRISDVNFDTGMLTVHGGKGKKGRTVLLPENSLD